MKKVTMYSPLRTPLQILLEEVNREKVGTYIFYQCETQGLLFANSTKEGYESAEFIEKFMNSDVAHYWDMPYDRYQWMGEAYNMEEFEDECNNLTKGKPWDNDLMHWLGFIYRYWHFYKEITSKEIYKIADARTVASFYQEFHAVSCDIVIDILLKTQKGKSIPDIS